MPARHRRHQRSTRQIFCVWFVSSFSSRPFHRQIPSPPPQQENYYRPRCWHASESCCLPPCCIYNTRLAGVCFPDGGWWKIEHCGVVSTPPGTVQRPFARCQRQQQVLHVRLGRTRAPPGSNPGPAVPYERRRAELSALRHQELDAADGNRPRRGQVGISEL